MAKGQSLKNVLKRGLRAGVRAIGPWVDGIPAPTRILTYHSIGHRRYEMNVTPEAFERQLAWLTEHHPVISLADAIKGQPGIALTFDDGYRDNFTHALPILERYGCPATVFVVSSCLGSTLPFEKEPETGALLSVTELRELSDRGIEIGGHTRTHPRLSTLTPADQIDEIVGCRSDLEHLLAKPVVAFAYPYGSALDYTRATVQATRNAGFQFACSNRFGPVVARDTPYEARRIWIDSTDTMASFQDKILGRLDLLRVQDCAGGIHGRRLLNRLLKTR